MQLENRPGTLEAVVCVCRRIIATLYDAYFPEAQTQRPVPTSRCPDSDILTLAWITELVSKDSERAWDNNVKANLGNVFPFLPERSRFSRRRRIPLWRVKPSAKHSSHSCHKQRYLLWILFQRRCVISNAPMALHLP
jgi:hypothetical protein